MAAATAAEKIEKHAHVGTVLTPKEDWEVQKLCEVIKAFSRRQVEELVARCGTMPMLCSYSNDGTPLMVKKRFYHTMGPEKVVREGGDDAELLVQRAIYRFVDCTGTSHTAIQVRDPLPLRHGKTGDAIFAASIDFFKTLREMGHCGIVLHHYAFDRAMHEFLFRRFRQHHSHLAKKDRAAQLSQSTFLHEPALMEWVVDTPCSNHDVHNALRWALTGYIDDEEMMKTIFAIAEGLRDGFGSLDAELDRFLAARVDFVDQSELFRHCRCHSHVGSAWGRARVGL